MLRRDLIATALAAPPLLLAGCANPQPGAGSTVEPAKAQVTVLYDAFGRDPALQKDWGYAAFVEVGGRRILFDTGNDAAILARNVAARHVDLARLDFVVMSHRHGDHMGGMSHLLAVNPKVRIYAPKEGFGVYGADLPGTFYRRDEALPTDQRYFDGRPPEVMRFGSAWPQADIALVDKTTTIAPGIHLISLVSDKPGTLELRELSLGIETPEGMVIVVGCSHAGIDRIVKAAAEIQPRIRLVVGGFHLVVAKDPDIEAIIAMLRDVARVAYVAPGHCTGEPTFAALRRAYGERYLYAGLGTTIAIDGTPQAIGGDDAAWKAASEDDGDLQTYRKLLAASAERRRGLFAQRQRTDSPGGAYLGQWRRSLAGCC
jgi:7,8-dihydropterin-6-yl-methyl-4-(beta-D-ribofuranosyl)aminobenzene 5'-phosphate synthase